MEWWEDTFSRNIRKKEAKRVWYLIALLLFIIFLIGISVWYQTTKIGQSQTISDVVLDGAILPVLLSVLLSIATFCYNKWDKNSEWAEQEVLIYSDILEYFSRILIAFEKDFRQDPKYSCFERDPQHIKFLDNIIEFKNLIKEKGKNGCEITKHFDMYNVEGLISKLSTQYLLIILNDCPKEPVRLFYKEIIMHLIKLDEDVKQYKTNVPILMKEAQENIVKMLFNYTTTLKLLYKIIYPIYKEGTGGNTMLHDINYYKEKMFGGIVDDNPEEKIKLEKNALQKAWEIRNFEIELYWKRTAYFWAFNTAIAIACYHIASSEGVKSMLLLSTLLALGIICSIAWFLSNIASKHWQENWENHINLLEDKKYGRIYKTTMSYYKNSIKPSVSRLNLKISAFVILAWIIAIVKFIISYYEINLAYIISYSFILLAIVVAYSWHEINILKDLKALTLLLEPKDYKNAYMCSGTNDGVNIIDVNE